MAEPARGASAQARARVLDIDLDFFADGALHNRGPGRARPSPEELPPWPMEEVIGFLEERCGLRGRLPGIVVENHGELFARWRSLIETGSLQAPFHLTHVDAHADLGQGELCQGYLLSELLHEEPGRRTRPRIGEGGLSDGSFLAFAIACRWITEIDYVYGFGGGEDIPGNFKPEFDWDAEAVQLAVLSKSEFAKLEDFFGPRSRPVPNRLEPVVPVTEIRWPDYQAAGPFDMVCLARSPAFTPPESDAIFDEIRRRHIDEMAFVGASR